MTRPSNPVVLGVIGAPHGVKGEVRLVSHTGDPLAIAGYGALWLDDGRALTLVSLRPQGDRLIARFDGVTTPEQAAALTNRTVHVDRSALPAPDDDEFYLADLEGLEVRDTAGAVIGQVVGLHDFGAGDIVEIARGRRSVMVPFTHAAIPVIDIAGGFIAVDPRAAGLLDDGEGDGR